MFKSAIDRYSTLSTCPGGARVRGGRCNLHNQTEEGLDGLYATCDKLAGTEMEHLIAKLRTAPDLAVLPHSDTPAVLGMVRRALERAGYEYPAHSMPF